MRPIRQPQRLEIRSRVGSASHHHVRLTPKQHRPRSKRTEMTAEVIVVRSGESELKALQFGSPHDFDSNH